MRSRDVSAVKIMRVWPFIISLVCVGLVLLFCIEPEARAQSGGTTVGVNCAKGGSINNALKLKADPLTIEIRGECHEDVVISRNNVTLRGVDPGATVVAQSIRAIWIDRASRVTLESLTVRGSTGTTGPTGAGIFVERSTGVTVSNVKAEGNREGMRTYGSSLRVVDSDFCRNRVGGLYIGNGSSLIIDGDEINTSENGGFGFLLSESTLRSTWTTVPHVVANDNGGAGFDMQGTAHAFLGSLEAKRNDMGIYVAGGSLSLVGSLDLSENVWGVYTDAANALLGFGDGEGVSVSGNNAGFGVFEGATLFFDGTLAENGAGIVADGASRVYLRRAVCQNNGWGVWVHGATVRIEDSTIQGNTSFGADVALSFGARASFDGDNDVGTVDCDETVLVEGDVSCPATTSVTVSPSQIERVAPKSRQPGDLMAPRWIP